MTKRLYMETTRIPADRTAGQIMSLLREAGSTEILTQYEKGRLTGLKFSLDVNRRTVIFVLPARVEPIFQTLNSRRKRGRISSADDDLEQAIRVAWRQLYRWTEAQLAMIETGMVDAAEVFLPYAQDQSGKTFWQVISEGGQLALPPAPDNVEEFRKKLNR